MAQKLHAILICGCGAHEIDTRNFPPSYARCPGCNHLLFLLGDFSPPNNTDDFVYNQVIGAWQTLAQCRAWKESRHWYDELCAEWRELMLAAPPPDQTSFQQSQMMLEQYAEYLEKRAAIVRRIIKTFGNRSVSEVINAVMGG